MSVDPSQTIIDPLVAGQAKRDEIVGFIRSSASSRDDVMDMKAAIPASELSAAFLAPITISLADAAGALDPSGRPIVCGGIIFIVNPHGDRFPYAYRLGPTSMGAESEGSGAIGGDDAFLATTLAPANDWFFPRFILAYFGAERSGRTGLRWREWLSALLAWSGRSTRILLDTMRSAASLGAEFPALTGLAVEGCSARQAWLHHGESSRCKQQSSRWTQPW